MAPYITFHGLSNGIHDKGLTNIRTGNIRGFGTKLGRFRLKWQKKSNFRQEGQGLAHRDLAYRLEREISRQIGVSGLTYVS